MCKDGFPQYKLQMRMLAFILGWGKLKDRCGYRLKLTRKRVKCTEKKCANLKKNCLCGLNTLVPTIFAWENVLWRNSHSPCNNDSYGFFLKWWILCKKIDIWLQKNLITSFFGGCIQFRFVLNEKWLKYIYS